MTFNHDFLEDLNSVRDDHRLYRLFNEKDIVRLNLWILEFIEDNYIVILYGTVIPSTMPQDSGELNKWFKKDIKEKSFNSSKLRISKLTYYNNGIKSFDIIHSLCKGFNLKDTCKNIGIKNPPSRYRNISLNIPEKEMDEIYKVRPIIFLETAEGIGNLINPRKPFKSPLSDSNAFMASLFCIDKSIIIPNNENIIPYGNEILKECLICLNNETGLNFKSSDSPRLCNIEFLSYSVADDCEISCVNFETVQSKKNEDLDNVLVERVSNKIKVTLINEINESYEVLVRCRLRNGEEIIFDQCQEIIIIQEKSVSAYFEAKEDSREILVTIWKRINKEYPWKLIYEDSNAVLREIHTSTGVMSGYRESKLSLLNKMNSKKPEIQNKVEEMRRINLTRYKKSILSSYEFDPWVPVSDDMRIAVRKLFPEPSEGRFFPKGWLQEGTLEFLEWIKHILTQNDSKIVIVDPYFDVIGIEIISQIEDDKKEFVVLTNTQNKSKDDLENESVQLDNDSQKPRVERIKDRCSELQPILQRLNLHIFDLVSKKKEQPFHDRYILTYGENEELKKGYHLSNSIQNATRNHPLLITPIPADLLNEINDYINDLVSKYEEQKSLKLIKLFSPNKIYNKVIYNEKNITDHIPYPKLFFKSLLQKKSIPLLSNENLLTYVKIGMIQNGNYIFLQANKFLLDLISADDAEFTKLWISLGEWLARTLKSDEYLHELVKSGRSELADQITSFILKSADEEFYINSLKSRNANDKEILELLKIDFPDILKDMEIFIKYQSPLPDLRFYGIHIGIRALITLNPNKLIEIFEMISNDIKNETFIDEKLLIKSNILKIILKEIKQNISLDNHEDLIRLLLKNKSSLLKSLGIQIIINYTQEYKANARKKSFNILNTLNKLENICAIAEWINSIRKNSFNYSIEDINKITKDMSKEIIRLWPMIISLEDLRTINKHLSGHSETNWADRTTNEILIPLVEKNKIDMDKVSELWLNILFEKLEKLKTENLTFIKSYESFTETCGYSIAMASPKKSKRHIRKLRHYLSPHERIAVIPYNRSNQYNIWIKSIRIILWMEAMIIRANFYKNMEIFDKLIYDLDENWCYISTENLQVRDNLIEYAYSIRKKGLS
ncbi:MAG: VPA1262 family protein [Methanobacterium sp.]